MMYPTLPAEAQMLIGAALPDPPTPAEKLARVSATAELLTDAALARDIVSVSDSIHRKAYLRELLWRWRDLGEVDRPWQANPDHTPWWEEFV